jgi:predicted nuclease of predicted toxin-antitoxin system
MRLLLDENLPKKLKSKIYGHEIFTVRDLGWNGKKNGELLKLMLDQGFEGLLTFDKNITNQQNFQKYPIPVLVLLAPNNQFTSLEPLLPNLLEILKNKLEPGLTLIKI